MTKINTIYLISHVHTDIGYTDHQEVLFRQQCDYIDRAIELCEATSDYPVEARYHWTCEVSSMVERYMHSRPASQIDRFLRLNAEGRIAVSGMQYHWTPMLSPAAMARSLYPVMRLRKDYGVRITAGMQCDVDGASWLWADLLPAIGIKGLTMSINAYRGDRPDPDLTAFWWEGPGGNRLLTFNGPHYAYGIFFYGMGNLPYAREILPKALSKLEAREDYPYDFLYAQATHPALPDNGPPFEALSDFVRDWNDSEGSPRIVFTTVDGFLDMLHERYGATSPTWRGDWADWWADGVGSSAYETAVNRTSEALLPALDLLATQVDGLDPDLIEQTYHDISLYDEHTWGSFNSINQPDSPFTRAQFNRKAGFAYTGYANLHDQLAKAGRKFARATTGKTPEGDVWREWRQGAPRDATADDSNVRFLIINPLSWACSFSNSLPSDSAGGAPYNFLEGAFIRNYRDSYPQSIAEGRNNRPDNSSVLHAQLPAFGYQVIAPSPAMKPDGAVMGEGWMENVWYRIQVDPETGGLLSWRDKEQGRELASQKSAWRLGQYVYESIDDPLDRDALFDGDFTKEGYGTQLKNARLRRQSVTSVQVGPALDDGLSIGIEVVMTAPGARSVRVRYALPHDEKALHVDFVVDKEPVTAAEAVYVMFPFALEQPTFHLDLNGVPLEVDDEQLPGSCRDWYGIQRWAEVSDVASSIVMAPVDAPLVQLGAIQTGRWAADLQAPEATLVAWPLNNYWTTNFQASQGGELLFRYRFTTMPTYDPAAASRFAAGHLVPPIIVRVPGAELSAGGQFMTVEPEGVADVQLKRAADGRGLIARAFNLTAEAQTIRLNFPEHMPTNANLCSPIEDDGEALAVVNGSITLAIPSRSLASARIIFS
ncbi:MAG: hypothetical protein J5I90_01900 [Caldilineales bacterium]|nr:hypothetical protein [Caldilineales bacterium]